MTVLALNVGAWTRLSSSVLVGLPKHYLSRGAVQQDRCSGFALQVRAFWSVLDSLWAGFRESRKCSRDTYPESYITKFTTYTRDGYRHSHGGEGAVEVRVLEHLEYGTTVKASLERIWLL